METSARRGADMLRHVLAFARGVESKKSSGAIQGAVARNGKNRARRISQEYPRSRPNIAADLWPVSGFATQLYQVLMNLCINARDAMPNGGQLSLRAEKSSWTARARKMHPDARPGAI